MLIYQRVTVFARGSHERLSLGGGTANGMDGTMAGLGVPGTGPEPGQHGWGKALRCPWSG